MKTLLNLIGAITVLGIFGGLAYVVLNGGATAFTGSRRAQSFDALAAPVIGRLGEIPTAAILAGIGLAIAGYIVFGKEAEE